MKRLSIINLDYQNKATYIEELTNSKIQIIKGGICPFTPLYWLYLITIGG